MESTRFSVFQRTWRPGIAFVLAVAVAAPVLAQSNAPKQGTVEHGSNRQLAQLLTDFGVPHTFETYEGDHTNRVPERIETRVLPFFSSQLSFSAGGR